MASAVTSGARGRMDEALAASERTRTSSGSARTYRTTASLATKSVLHAILGEPTVAMRVVDQARHDNPAYRDSVVLDAEVIAHWYAGRYRRAADVGRELEKWVPVTQFRRLSGLAFTAHTALELADLAEAERVLARMEATLRGRDWMFCLPLARWASGLASVARGRADVGVEMLAAAADRLAEMGAKGLCVPVLLDLAESAGEIGSLAPAARAAQQSAEVAAVLDRPMPHGVAAAAAAWAALAGGHCDVAVERAREAVARLDGGECAGFAARAHALLGQVMLGVDRPAGIAELAVAAGRFDALGATRRRDRVLELLRRQGSAGRRASAAAAGPGSLTQREDDVARLAARGLSAREIGQALFIGERTVETHLSRIYAKLAVESKLDLVRRAGEFDLA
ncbi:MAG: LuxR C-terminal-related transcriptional regulator [Sporichthyaceae bacterium]